MTQNPCCPYVACFDAILNLTTDSLDMKDSWMFDCMSNRTLRPRNPLSRLFIALVHRRRAVWVTRVFSFGMAAVHKCGSVHIIFLCPYSFVLFSIPMVTVFLCCLFNPRESLSCSIFDPCGSLYFFVAFLIPVNHFLCSILIPVAHCMLIFDLCGSLYFFVPFSISVDHCISLLPF